ncbi:quinone oxidoreductase [Sphingosinicella sp. BN140058]|uniref:quinone oxidoreductase family protein n=1 Tax=Sphingosinicella sp. BN140058 TaxID=1892855 RepID=UPI0010113850|nr:quinone oxidoreductase [Sphingosinicella sp. BN140058]QAY76888.1 quinone oxidoreductase [Sphingosinicella sp. BN140058]
MSDPFAFLLRETGGPEKLEAERIAIPRPEAGQVLIRHEAIGLNFIDTYHRSGLYPLPLPSGIGNEASGVIEAVGDDVSGFREGNRVGYFTGPLGAYATHRVVDADRLVPLPEALAFEDAAATMLKGCTAEYLIERCAEVRSGDWVLVHAAAGGVGSILLPWLKAIGALVIAHVGDTSKVAVASALGADHVFCCPMEDLAAEVRALTAGKGVAVVLDGVGASSWKASLASVARRGMIVTYGNASGPVPPFTALDLLSAGSVFVTRPTLGDYCQTPQEMRASAARLFEMIEKRVVQVRIGARFALRDAAEAHRAIESRSTTGSTVLLP